MKISALPTLTAVDIADEFVMNDVSSSTTKRATLSAVLSVIFPVGSIYSNGAVSTNPATTWGFGTWVPDFTGQAMVGVNSSDTDFATLGQTGGEKAHTLTTSEMPAHNHGVSDPGHAHSFNLPTYVANGGGGLNYAGGGSTWHYQDGPYGTNGAGTGISIANNGGGAAHNVMSPYKVAAVWRRTA